MKSLLSLTISLFLSFSTILHAQTVSVGNGSYTTNFPGTDVAGRNGFPSGTAHTTGKAANKTIPTNDWWSAKVKNSHADNLFNYPYTLKTTNSGLVVSYIPWGVIDNIEPIVVGVSGLNASAAKVSDFSDWTVSMDWQNSTHHFEALSGIGMPFLYFTKDSANTAEILVNQGTVTISNEMLVIENARNNADFAIYAPSGSSWTQNGNRYTSTLNGKNYWSMAFIPLTATNVTTVANSYKSYAYVFPTNTTVDWKYDSSSSTVLTNFIVETEVKEGTDTNMLLGLLPHQWDNLSANSPAPSGNTYATVRGDLKTLIGNRFSVSNTFYGILPTLPYLDYRSQGFDPAELDDKIKALENDQLNPWTDSYNEGQMMNRLIQTARIADLMGDTVSVNKIVKTVKERLEDWLAYASGEKAFLFYYNQNWTTLIGYPAGHGQDNNINDHHFHWGYFIHAASFVEQFQPSWANQWGDMVNLLVRDAASSNRSDSLFPFLRNFSPYAGHCWANGFATFPQGNDQESTSESMQFNSSLIHWGSVTNNDEIRDLGIYLYTTEQTAIEEYWLDVHERNFRSSQQYSLVSRVWGNSYDNGTFWTNDISASYGIELYPIHGGSLYLGQDTNYVSKLWTEIESNTGILKNEANANLWHDVMWEYLAFYNPKKAIQLYDSYSNRDLKFGISDAQTYHWLHAMNVLGIVDANTTADHPLATVFKKDSISTYVAHNYNSDTLTVTYSDGYVLTVPPNSMATSKDLPLSGTLSSDFSAVYPGGSIPLRVDVSDGTPTKVEFLMGSTVIGEDTLAPYELTAKNIAVGNHRFYARLYQGNEFNLSNMLSITSGEQLPYSGNPIPIPGTIEAGNYDLFEGGSARGISYNDNDLNNNGNFRTDEAVDASSDATEGNTVGWINSGEWLEYTIDVQKAGFHDLSFRYASGNVNGGGSFYLISGKDTIATVNSVASTNGWNTWSTQTLNFVPLKSGIQVLRIAFGGGEFNLGKLTFTYASTLLYSQPVADAGGNQLVVIPTDTALLDGSSSTDPYGGTLSYQWKQVYGPIVLTFSSDTAAQPIVSTLSEGVYLLQLEVSNGSYSDDDFMYLISSNSNNIAPKVSIYSPLDQSEYLQFDSILIAATASDLNGNVRVVDFYANSVFISSDSAAPFESKWVPKSAESFSLTAVATDNDSASTTSAIVTIDITPPPPCKDSSSNKEFLYEFSTAKNNPTITFIPTLSGMGSPTCILYYGTSISGPLPGYIVTPNVPFQITASQGDVIYFYYTYSYPGQGQHDNSANKDSYTIGSCSNVTGLSQLDNEMEFKYYPNPVNDILTIELPEGRNQLFIYNSSASLIDQFNSSERMAKYNMQDLKAGVYIFKLSNGKQSSYFKVIR